MTLTATEIFLYGSGLTFLGVALGWLANHWLSTARDMRTRRGNFEGCLRQWRSALARCSPRDNHTVWRAYADGVHGYHLELGRIREDFRFKREFWEVADKLGNLQPEEMIRDGHDYREPPCTLIDRLLAFLK